MITGFLHYCTLLSPEFLLFPTMPISVETVTLTRTANTICLMVTFTIHAFEGVRTWLPCFGSHLVGFLVFHATPCSFSVVFYRVSSIALGTSGDMRMTVECWVALFPTVLTLQNAWVHIHSSNSSNEMSNIEAIVDDILCQRTALGIPDIYPNDHHVRFGRCFDNTWF